MQVQIILKHQSPESVICKLKQDVQNTITFFEAQKSTNGSRSAENKFWKDLQINVVEEENKLDFSMRLEGDRFVRLEFKDRS